MSAVGRIILIVVLYAFLVLKIFKKCIYESGESLELFLNPTASEETSNWAKELKRK